MKQLILLTLLLTPMVYAQESLQLACINGNINKIKTETNCQSYIEEIKTIVQPNCMYSSTLATTTKIMKEAKKNNCVIEAPKNVRNAQPTQRVFNYSSEADVGRLLQYIDAYNEEIGLKAN